MMDLQSIGKRIKAVRTAQRLTQQELAELVDLSTTYISVIERGAKIPKLETLIALANFLKVSTGYLLADVVDASLEVAASEISEQLKNLSSKRQKEILQILRFLIVR